MRFHAIQNVETALRFLRYKEIKLVNIRGEDIVDGNPKLTLGLIWTIILHFQVGTSWHDPKHSLVLSLYNLYFPAAQAGIAAKHHAQAQAQVGLASVVLTRTGETKPAIYHLFLMYKELLTIIISACSC